MKNAIAVFVFALVIAALVTVSVLRNGVQPSHWIAVIPKMPDSAYWECVAEGAMKACKEEKYGILWGGPENETDCALQIQMVEDKIARKVDGIVLAPSNRKALVPVVEKAYARKIPCVIIDSDVDTDKYVSYLATDNYKGGVLAARRMGEVLTGKGKILVVAWTPNSAATDTRLQGFRETLTKEFPGIAIVDSQFPDPPTMDKARDVTQDMLTRNAGVDGLFACNATTAGGALTALRSFQQGDKKIKMVGFDVWPMVVDGLEKGDLDSLIVQNPYKMGYEGVKTIVRHLKGEKVDKQVDTGVELITRDRLKDPKVRERLESQIESETLD
jgi:ribose transport system substrate-binding protein